ncbi:MAG: ribosome assembly cofactor RimP [Bacteroidota bacterium]
MITDKQIADIIEEKFSGTEFFIADLKVRPGNRIMLSIDSDKGVTIEDCIHVSKFIESKLDREIEDYELNVESAGLDRPMKLPRQFKKNIGREITCLDEEGKKLKGMIMAADENGITLKPAATKKDKQKKVEPALLTLKYGEFRDAKVEVSFS